jgi:hypothetical protein
VQPLGRALEAARLDDREKGAGQVDVHRGALFECIIFALNRQLISFYLRTVPTEDGALFKAIRSH